MVHQEAVEAEAPRQNQVNYREVPEAQEAVLEVEYRPNRRHLLVKQTAKEALSVRSRAPAVPEAQEEPEASHREQHRRPVAAKDQMTVPVEELAAVQVPVVEEVQEEAA